MRDESYEDGPISVALTLRGKYRVTSDRSSAALGLIHVTEAGYQPTHRRDPVGPVFEVLRDAVEHLVRGER